MQFTTNATTMEYGHASVTVIADSITMYGARITTLELVYPYIVHAQLIRHRMLSPLSLSFRATPTRVLIDEVENHPYVPTTFHKTQKGMVAGERLSPEEEEEAREIWLLAASDARQCALDLMNLRVAKEHVNRILSPFLYTRNIVTATEWDNFFKLRLDKEHVQPEMYELAYAMKTAMDRSEPEGTDFHLPYVPEYDRPVPFTQKFLVSAARCARCSYLTHNARVPTLKEDLTLALRLLKDGHLSPFEHVACSGTLDGGTVYFPRDRFANFSGWESMRHMLERDPDLLPYFENFVKEHVND